MEQMQPAVDNDTVVVGMVEEPDSLVQDFSTSHATWVVLNLLLAKPVRFDADWRATPQMLEEIPTPGDGGWERREDGSWQVTWRFRRDFRWHDGEPVTAYDALESYHRLRAMAPPYPHFTVVSAISEMFVPEDDPYRLVIRWRPEDPISPFEEWGTILPAHRFRGTDLLNLENARSLPFCASPVYQGPFQFKAWERGKFLKVEAAPSCPLGRPSLRHILFRFYSSPDDLARAVIHGEVDVTELTGFQPEHMRLIEQQAPGVQTFFTPAMLWEHIDFNLDDPWLKDWRVRQALIHAIDRAGLVTHLFGPTQPVAHTWLPPRHSAHNAKVAAYAYDPDLASRLLAEAGFVRGADNWLYDPQGRPFELTLSTTDAVRRRYSATGNRPELAEAIQADLRQVGVALKIDLHSPAQFSRLIRERRFPHMAMFAWSMAPETNGYLLWHSTQRPTETGEYGVNISGWRNVQNDALLTAVLNTADRDEVDALLRQQQETWARDLPAIPLFFWPWLTTAKRCLQNVRPVGMFGTYVTWNAHEWRWAQL